MKKGIHTGMRDTKVSYSKITPDQVQEIVHKLQSGQTPPQIANQYNISPAAIYQIRRGKAWQMLRKEEKIIDREDLIVSISVAYDPRSITRETMAELDDLLARLRAGADQGVDNGL